MPDPPIACTLSPDGMTARLALIDALASDGLLDRSTTASGVRVRLRDTPDVERRTRELVAAESACCAFLDFTLGREDGDLVLDITGPRNARLVIEMFFAAEAAWRRMSPLRWTLVALLVASTALFAVRVIAERSSTDTHAEPAAAHVAETGGESGEPEGAHGEGGASDANASGEAGHVESATGHTESERLFGVDVESTPLVVVAVLVGLALAAVAASRIGPARGVCSLSPSSRWRGRSSTSARSSTSSTSRAPGSAGSPTSPLLHLTIAASSRRLATQPPATP